MGDRSIAYRAAGEGPADLFISVGNGSSIEVWPEDPSLTPFFRQLTDFARVVLFDPIGLGASERVSAEALPPWRSWKDDLLAVMDAVGTERAALFGALDGGICCIDVAARDDRVGWLFLLNATARLLAADDYPEGVPRAEHEKLLATILAAWGSDDIGRIFHPGRADDPRFLSWYAKLIRSVGTPATFRERMLRFYEADARDMLPRIGCPTVVLHRREYRAIPFAQGRYLADHIEGAEFIELEGAGSLAGEDIEPVIDPIRNALAGPDHRKTAGRQFATVMFTDIVGSTRATAELGDVRWQELMTVHDRITDRWVADSGGRIVKSTGDGTLATFPDAQRALRCALELVHMLEDEDILVRVGVHAGEIHLRENGDITGIAVNIAKRICDLAPASGVLVSREIRSLVPDAPYAFQDQGSHAVKGVTEPVRSFLVKDLK